MPRLRSPFVSFVYVSAAAVAVIGVGVASLGAHAATPASFVRADTTAEQAVRASLLSVVKPRPQGSGQLNGFANPSRAYPPSCFSDQVASATGNIEPLPVTPSGPTWGGNVALYSPNATGGVENVTITIWRVPCSSSGSKLSYNSDGGPTAAVLFRIQRAAGASTTSLPGFPSIRIAQGSIAFDDKNFRDYVRAVAEPNTVLIDTRVDSLISTDTTYVLENYSELSSVFSFNRAFQIRFDNGYIDSNKNPTGQVVFNVPDYNPTSSTYPAAFQPMPISGYLSNNWADPAPHSGEGLVTQIFDAGDGKNRVFSALWFTYDTNGNPFWLGAQTTMAVGTTQLTNVPVYYFTAGGFAGAFGPAATRNTWGTMNVSFADCNHVNFSYNGTTSKIPVGPQGSGQRKWQAVGVANNIVCE